MKHSLEESLTIAENLISAIKNCKDKDLILKLEATLMCFQFRIKTLTKDLK